MAFANKEELALIIEDLQNQLVNLQQTVDALAPVKEETPAEETPETDEGSLSEEESNDIDDMFKD